MLYFHWIPEMVFAFLATLIFIALLKHPAYRLGLVDRPNARKHHHETVPLIGGVAMVFVFSLSLWLLGPSIKVYQGLLGAIVLLTLVGLYDDLRDIPAYGRFIAQTAAALIMIVVGGEHLVDLGNLTGWGRIELGNWAVPFTVFCVVGVINALNMVDGVDGLAGGVALITTVWLIVLALLAGQHPLDVAVLTLLAATILGFLCFNLRHPWRSRATVFMGDAGSMSIGFILAWFLVDFSQGAQRVYEPVIALWLFALPLLDTVAIMTRRLLKRQSPFKADRQHLHHIFLQAGYSDAQTTGLLLALATLAGAVGVAGWYWQVPAYVLFYAFVGLFAAYFYALHHAWLVTKKLKEMGEAMPNHSLTYTEQHEER